MHQNFCRKVRLFRFFFFFLGISQLGLKPLQRKKVCLAGLQEIEGSRPTRCICNFPIKKRVARAINLNFSTISWHVSYIFHNVCLIQIPTILFSMTIHVKSYQHYYRIAYSLYITPCKTMTLKAGLCCIANID